MIQRNLILNGIPFSLPPLMQLGGGSNGAVIRRRIDGSPVIVRSSRGTLITVTCDGGEQNVITADDARRVWDAWDGAEELICTFLGILPDGTGIGPVRAVIPEQPQFTARFNRSQTRRRASYSFTLTILGAAT